ncbi:MAG: hypothetical protein GQ570_14085 [Helicobacteraceae bacterium]|nr:hypothetical protein [Helicobacteraceae bacterium]
MSSNMTFQEKMDLEDVFASIATGGKTEAIKSKIKAFRKSMLDIREIAKLSFDIIQKKIKETK